MTGTQKYSIGRQILSFGIVGAAALLTALPAVADGVGYSMYGTAGIIDMPTARMNKDGVLATTFSSVAGTIRSNLTFQITPRLSGSFRYTSVDGLVVKGFSGSTYYDRSFDFSYQLLTEGKYRPAVTIGLRDFMGTGLYSGEYVVASKEILTGVNLTGGLGWGRLASYNSFGKTGKRPSGYFGKGGIPSYNKWFRGKVAPFGGISWDVTRKLTLKAEYSSDIYRLEQRDGLLDRKTPFNFGADYKFDSGIQLSAFSIHGDAIGALLTIAMDPRKHLANGGLESAPLPVAVRAEQARSQLGWVGNSVETAHRKDQLAQLLKLDGLDFAGLKLEPHRAVVRVSNRRYGSTPQAVGRIARAMTRVLPASVETFVIVPVDNGLELAAITIKRSDLENLEHASAAEILKVVSIEDGRKIAPPPEQGLYPKFEWSLGPYGSYSMFDPDEPFRYELGARLSAKYQFSPGLEISGSVIKKLIGTLDDTTRRSPSRLPRVRTDKYLYHRHSDLSIEQLTMASFWRPFRNVYGRLTVGYLEQMYAGASAEVLWKPVNSRLSFGAELNVVRPREYSGGFGFRGYSTQGGTIPKINGHLSAYYSMKNGFHGQLDVGRYLAGDYGATFSLDREFRNGWRVGAWATFTNVSAKQFGEGSFDKGIRMTIPISWGTSRPSRKRPTIVLQSLTRDGGARLNVSERLYEKVRDYHRPIMSQQWGKFWR